MKTHRHLPIQIIVGTLTSPVAPRETGLGHRHRRQVRIRLNISHAASTDNVGISGRLQCGGTVVVQEVIQRP
jgi:hypothetical protein